MNYTQWIIISNYTVVIMSSTLIVYCFAGVQLLPSETRPHPTLHATSTGPVRSSSTLTTPPLLRVTNNEPPLAAMTAYSGE